MPANIRARIAVLADAIDLLRTYHPACDCPAVCASCRTVAGLRREIDQLARPGTNAAHAGIHGGMFWARRSGAVSTRTLPGDHPSGLGYMCAADFE